MVMNMGGRGARVEMGFVTNISNGYAVIPLPFRPAMCVAIYNGTSGAGFMATAQFGWYYSNGVYEISQYQGGGASATVAWHDTADTLSHWDSETNTLYMRVIGSATYSDRYVSYIAIG